MSEHLEPRRFLVAHMKESEIVDQARHARSAAGVTDQAAYFNIQKFVDVLEIRYDNFGLEVQPDSWFKENVESFMHEGFIYVRESVWDLAISSLLSSPPRSGRRGKIMRLAGRARFTIAHEIGHWFLHRAQAKSLNRMKVPSNRNSCSEYQADFFAAHLLVSTAVLEDIERRGSLNAGHVAEVCGVSTTCAQKCIRKYNLERHFKS